jgi:hypothetical protein
MTAAADPVFDPVGAAVSVVAAAGPALAEETIRRVVERACGGRAKSRRLAAALAANPSVLVTGRSPAPKAVGDLLLALRAAGAAGVSAPRCAGCGREVTSMQRRGNHWYCSPCFDRPLACASCGNVRQVASRDRRGRPRCGQCPDQDTRDPRPGAPLVRALRAGSPDRGAGTRRRARHLRQLLPAARRRLQRLRQVPALQLRCQRPSGLPVVLAEGDLRLRPLQQDQPPAARWPEGPVCDPCYAAALRARARCAGCGQDRRLVFPPGPDAVTCADCPGILLCFRSGFWSETCGSPEVRRLADTR